jgi:glycosyltransferase involved in cell wall biosynthesis
LIAQTEQNWEAIVIDDCSTDNSVEIIENLIIGEQRFRFIKNEENIGYQKTLIKGIEHSESSIFGRLDPDDALKPKAIELSLEAFSSNNEIGMTYTGFIFCDEKLNELKEHHCKQIESLNTDYYGFRGEISHFACFRKEVYNKTTGIDTFIKRAEDKDIYMKMCEIAEVKLIDNPQYLYRIHSGGVSNNKNSEKALFWHWVALIKMAERRNINIEDLFIEHYIPKNKYLQLEDKINSLKKSRLLKLLYKLGIFKAYKYL